MQRRLVIVAIGVMAAFALGGGLTARSQEPLPDGALVRGLDGSEWVVRFGVKHPINWITDEGDVLATLPVGPAVSNVADVPNAAASTGEAGLKADYQFQNSYQSGVGTPPVLLPLGSPRFTSESIDGVDRTVLAFAAGEGVSLSPTSGVIPHESYTIVLLMRLETLTGLRRIIELTPDAADRRSGLYTAGNRLDLRFSGPPATGEFSPNEWVQVALTRDGSTGQLSAYLNGALAISRIDTNGVGVISAAERLIFFRDPSGSHSAGAIARLRLYDRPLTVDEIVRLGRLP